MAQIDVSKPGFLARRDLPPISRLAIPTEGVASSRLSLEEEIDKFNFEEEQSSRALLICI